MSHAAEAPEFSPKRRAIVDAAAALFMAEGFGAVSMDAVARAAQVSKATLYAHFPGKEALFLEIIGSNCRKMQAMMDVALSASGLTLEGALTELGQQWLRFLLRREVRALHRVVIGEGVRFPHLARDFYAGGPQSVRRWLAGWLASQQQAGQLQADIDLLLVAEQFLSLLRGDLFLRATLGLVTEGEEDEIAALAARAAQAIVRLYGTVPDGAA
ncbi:TetR/AcrR family transcriptional regulator [Roseomonas sp. M0104]|uniref:TetR/AcrR family transcriptional regulator n=1 Tax=Teichococcus coralli TaxID=2545983 RepID=A0A845BGS3_9PROT|nr:TetR/AcrR family transcriptional regulator [Pseudoroseomonas coralli]MXP64537.1 TetR/AcrR family transcriptional regulator [Pseudoroseomonas coralli]